MMSQQLMAADVRRHIQQLREAGMGAFGDELEVVLEAADESWGMVARLYHEGATADLHPDTVAECERILDDYKWLEEAEEER